ncbi:hypothetical protein [Poseidonocella sp. HB161398]|uniref:hypothetical protein n=1 Tax=Poseidonocella sp. HB161398 TaxID=2320855 RepID=UPI001980D0E4|nr:hypothetical protein [Poseidonocella sp. HB161398]
MIRFVLRLLMLSALVLWTALPPSGPAQAMAMAAPCCDPAAPAAAPAGHGHHGAMQHATLCMAHCFPADRAALPAPALPERRVSRFDPRPAAVTAASRSIAPAAPPPRL